MMASIEDSAASGTFPSQELPTAFEGIEDKTANPTSPSHEPSTACKDGSVVNDE